MCAFFCHFVECERSRWNGSGWSERLRALRSIFVDLLGVFGLYVCLHEHEDLSQLLFWRYVCLF